MTAEWIASHVLLDRLRGTAGWQGSVEEALQRGTLRARGRRWPVEPGAAEAIPREFWFPVSASARAIAAAPVQIDFNTAVARRPTGRSFPKFVEFEHVEFSAADVDHLWPAVGEPPASTTERLVHRGGRLPGADWDAVWLAFDAECDRRGGLPHRGHDDPRWRAKADAERFVAALLDARKEPKGMSVIRKRLTPMFALIKAKGRTGTK